MTTQMSFTTPPTTPRQSKDKMNPMTPSTCANTPMMNPMTPSTCANTPLCGSRRMSDLSLSPGGYPEVAQWSPNQPPPNVLDPVSVSLMSLLPSINQNDGELGPDKMAMTRWPLHKALPIPGPARALSPPSTPRRNTTSKWRDVSRSPPPAPNQRKVALGEALEENDLVHVVEILAKHPQLATMPFWDNNELPLERATRLQCDEHILEFLKHNGADLGGDENLPMNQNPIPFQFMNA